MVRPDSPTASCIRTQKIGTHETRGVAFVRGPSSRERGCRMSAIGSNLEEICLGCIPVSLTESCMTRVSRGSFERSAEQHLK